MADDFDDMSADIEAAMKGDAPAEAVAAEPILPADTQETPEQTEARTRDENGRFAKAPEDVQDTPASGEEPAKTILPPRSWTAAAKSKFAQLDPDVQQEVLRREREIEAGKQQWDTKAEAFNKLDAVIAPVRDRLTMSGLTPDTYIAALVRADEMLRGPQQLQAIQMLAQQYGINLGAIQGGPQAQPQQWQPDPQYQALQSQFQQLQARLDQDAQAKQDQEHQATLARIEAFASDPANIYFDNVRGEMAAFISSGAAKDLPDAYDMAIHARPDIRQLLAAAAASKAQTAPTRPNGLSVTGAQRGAAKANGTPSTGNVEDDVLAAFREVEGRV